ncbi:DUF4389 domain-containing protein [Stutzerimonas kirkiae]|uniref:DUF4389 domain-containing protein n=1 Tax=Stutzerimonas kirkiae TaxID=2211392 RepID=A0A4Q9QZI4_9GAMM|nr:DUF4389 domain-containing protein [Stutzerimonas kirkiae]TBU91310.1 DUF4389 domain-containing protein [Stutzerimonas kirkiae]TBV00420.1 DUF4389 domain-containing protein [Stutzerimonas kirkiae]TBV11786.1 DUF4389 domain-containing protein [Stutzerimonas kirkiae]TBV15287.1 DUF4389 domain-containing protein [Stutzerimonas kirkiae]
MNRIQRTAERESLLLRGFWLLIFFFVWQLAELVLLAVVLAQLVLRLAQGSINQGLQAFGDSLSQYLAQIGRYATFNSERKPWPLSDWPVPRPADIEVVQVVTPEEPKA